jgi:VanZ family protein
VTASHKSTLVRYLLGAYALLIVYASLHPFHGWHDRGASLFAFLEPTMPKFVTLFDVGINFVAYVPLGFLIIATMHPMQRVARAVLLACAASAALSGAMEAIQTLLPNRVSSNIDFAANSAGGLAGALIGLWIAPRLIDNAGLQRLRFTWFHADTRTDLGLVIIALWLFAQLNPEALMFGTGNLRGILQAVPATLHPAEVFVGVEALVSAAHLVAIGLFVGTLVQPGRSTWMIIGIIVAAAIMLRSIAFAILFAPENAFRWVTSGAMQGIAAGVVMLVLLVQLRASIRLAIAGLFLMFATVLANVVPGNPYTANALQVWYPGHFLNFKGLTGFVSSLWPFVALGYLIFAAVAQREQEFER